MSKGYDKRYRWDQGGDCGNFAFDESETTQFKANAIGDTAFSTRKTGDNRRKRIHILFVDRTIGDAKPRSPHLAILDNLIDRPNEDVE